MGTDILFIRFKLNHLLLMIRSSTSNFHLNVIAPFCLGAKMSLTTALRMLNKRLFQVEICWRRKLCFLLYSKIPFLTLILSGCIEEFLGKETQGLRLKKLIHQWCKLHLDQRRYGEYHETVFLIQTQCCKTREKKNVVIKYLFQIYSKGMQYLTMEVQR